LIAASPGKLPVLLPWKIQGSLYVVPHPRFSIVPNTTDCTNASPGGNFDRLAVGLHYGYGTKLFDINSSGVIVGSYHLNGNDHAFQYSGGAFKDVVPPNSTGSVNTGINEYGFIKGQATLSGVTVGYTAHCQ
jgi:hypothetical protein